MPPFRAGCGSRQAAGLSAGREHAGAGWLARFTVDDTEQSDEQGPAMGDVIAFRPRPVDPAQEPAAEAPPARGSAAASRPVTLPADPKLPTRGAPLWREVAGAVLREERQRQQRTLAHVAERAG